MTISNAKKRPRKATEKVPGTAAFTKFMSVLQIIGDSPREYGISDLCKIANLPRATLYRIVDALRAEGLIAEATPGNKFALGPRLINLASRSWATFDLRTIAHPHIERLRDETGETVHLAVPSGLEMVYIDKLESPQAVRMTSRIGTRITLYSSSVGKAYLAALPPEELNDILGKIAFNRYTAHTITQRKALEAELKATLKRGYSLDREETELEIRCVGAAIVNATGRPVGGISVSVPKYRYDKSVEARLSKIVRMCAERIGDQMADAESPQPDYG
jgi:DNA-binding IclR family transcriptional regulator